MQVMLKEYLLGYEQIKKDLTVLMYLKEEYVKRMDRISMKYGKHGVKEEDSGSIHSVLSRKWRKTESEGETLNVEKNQNGSFISLLYSRDFFFY